MPGPISSKIGKTPDCALCVKPVYFMEQVQGLGRCYHKTCFKCHFCNKRLETTSYSEHGGQLCCKACKNRQGWKHSGPHVLSASFNGSASFSASNPSAALNGVTLLRQGSERVKRDSDPTPTSPPPQMRTADSSLPSPVTSLSSSLGTATPVVAERKVSVPVAGEEQPVRLITPHSQQKGNSVTRTLIKSYSLDTQPSSPGHVTKSTPILTAATVKNRDFLPPKSPSVRSVESSRSPPSTPRTEYTEYETASDVTTTNDVTRGSYHFGSDNHDSASRARELEIDLGGAYNGSIEASDSGESTPVSSRHSLTSDLQEVEFEHSWNRKVASKDVFGDSAVSVETVETPDTNENLSLAKFIQLNHPKATDAQKSPKKDWTEPVQGSPAVKTKELQPRRSSLAESLQNGPSTADQIDKVDEQKDDEIVNVQTVEIQHCAVVAPKTSEIAKNSADRNCNEHTSNRGVSHKKFAWNSQMKWKNVTRDSDKDSSDESLLIHIPRSINCVKIIKCGKEYTIQL